MKAGHKTSEFYVALIAAIIPVLNTHFGLEIPVESIVGFAAYIISRGVAKFGTGAQ